MRTVFHLLQLFFCICLSINLSAKTFYLDPVHGNIANDGSKASPWGTLQEVIESNMIESFMWAEHPPTASTSLIIKNNGAPVKAGDTLMLLSGYHGSITLMEYFNTKPITIMAPNGQVPIISNLHFIGGCNWIISGLTISPEFAESYKRNTLIFMESHGWRGPVTKCNIQNCKGYSVNDASGWTKEQWDTLSCNAIQSFGDSNLIENNHFRNVNFGITVSGNQTIVRNNSIVNFSGDGLRGLGNDLLFEYNTVKNCYAVNGNHDDGFQSWCIDDNPPRERVILRGNTIINYEDINQPFRGTLQGIGCFDGPYIDWIIENNVIITDHWHGISLYGAQNCRIINNTVIDLNNERPGPPWIGVFDHKDGTPSKNCLIRNNIATDYNMGEGCEADHNMEIIYDDYNQYFIDASNFNLNLVEGCDAIDAGFLELAPLKDIDRKIRPFGEGVDLGAYEFGSHVNLNDSDDVIGDRIFYCYPNPFTEWFSVKYKLTENSRVRIDLFDILGRFIANIENVYKEAGIYKLDINPIKYSLYKGLYICRFSDNIKSESFIISCLQ